LPTPAALQALSLSPSRETSYRLPTASPVWRGRESPTRLTFFEPSLRWRGRFWWPSCSRCLCVATPSAGHRPRMAP